MNKSYLNLLDCYAEATLPPTLPEVHLNDNIPISDDFYSATRPNEELADNMNNSENKERDGSNLSAKKDKEEDDEIDNIKKRKNKKDIFEPHPPYDSAYGRIGIDGLTTDLLDYYSGSISEEPGAITNNVYNTVYQSASARDIRLKIRAMIYEDYIAYV